MGVSTRAYILNMSILLHSLREKPVKTLSGLDPTRFQSKVEGKPTALYTLTNQGMEACITNYGARLVSLMVPDRYGRVDDVVLGFDNIDDYHQQKNNFGSVVGRYIGRIKGASFELDGKTYQLQQTGGGNISHGGYPGFADKPWEMVGKTDTTLVLKYVSPDGENGFPGTLTVFVTYHLKYNHALTISYEAQTDKPTVLNLSNHSFFNISGDLSSSVLSQQLMIDSKKIATFDKNKNVDGRLVKVRHTPFDFTKMKTIGKDINVQDEQLAITKGYDHSFALRKAGKGKHPAVILYDEKSGRRMSVYTDQPAVQVYTANGLNGKLVGKNGIAYQSRSAICLETMHFADSPHHSTFPSTVLRPGETFQSSTTFAFDTK
ncbi:MAG: galactose mutarotase [Prevotella sp.]|nr:galactose mutarotase [Prevotella sp.]